MQTFRDQIEVLTQEKDVKTSYDNSIAVGKTGIASLLRAKLLTAASYSCLAVLSRDICKEYSGAISYLRAKRSSLESLRFHGGVP